MAKQILLRPNKRNLGGPSVEVIIRLREPLQGVPVEWLESAAGRKRAKSIFRSNEAKLRALLLAGVPVRIERVPQGRPVRICRFGKRKKAAYLSSGS